MKMFHNGSEDTDGSEGFARLFSKNPKTTDPGTKKHYPVEIMKYVFGQVTLDTFAAPVCSLSSASTCFCPKGTIMLNPNDRFRF